MEKYILAAVLSNSKRCLNNVMLQFDGKNAEEKMCSQLKRLLKIWKRNKTKVISLTITGL